MNGMKEEIFNLERNIEELKKEIARCKNEGMQEQLKDAERELEKEIKDLEEAKELLPYPLRWCEFYGEISVYDMIIEALSEYEKDDRKGIAHINVYIRDEYSVELSSQEATHPDWRTIYTLEDEDLVGKEFFKCADKIFGNLEEII